MGLVLPNLNDKPFEQIFEEARGLIPSTAPDWTDHNVHDPGITFIELFAWLAEIEHYRLNRTSAESYARFFSLMGIAPFGAQPAQVTISFKFSGLGEGILVPANTRISAIGNESAPFETLQDLYLTPARLEKVITKTGDQETVQTTAEKTEVGHYAIFGSSPAVGDSLQLEFSGWFEEPQGHLTIVLFENDLPPRVPFTAGAKGFEPSANVRWQYRTNAGWTDLDVIEDGTLNFSRSGELVFRSPMEAGAANFRQIRAVLSGGRYEIPPRVVNIKTNTIRARQVETIVNEDLKKGLGTADQVVRLQKYPLLINNAIPEGIFQVGDVLDWDALIDRLKRPEELFESPLKETVIHIATELREVDPDALTADSPITPDQKYKLAAAFNKLISEPDLYEKKKFLGVHLPDELSEASRERACQSQSYVRRLNRFLLQRVFPDLFISDRLEIQTGRLGAPIEDEPKAWHNWDRVDNFFESAPSDRHYVLDPATGKIRFGNGLNGRVPETTESIRARFYRHSRLDQGNLAAGHAWTGLVLPPNVQIDERKNLLPASGGKEKETIAETRTRSREVFRKQTAIITATDYENLALNTPGLRVARAKVLPNFNPKLRKLKLPGEVTIIVVPQPPPKKAFPNAPPPLPGSGFLKTVTRHLEHRRMVTTNLHVIGPEYLEVRVRCQVFLKKRASKTEALESINRALKEFLDPIFGGPDKGRGWPFGRPIFPSEVSQQLAKLPDVDYVTRVSLNDLKAGEPFKLPYNGLPIPASGAHAIELVEFENRGREAGPCEGGDSCG